MRHQPPSRSETGLQPVDISQPAPIHQGHRARDHVIDPPNQHTVPVVNIAKVKRINSPPLPALGDDRHIRLMLRRRVRIRGNRAEVDRQKLASRKLPAKQELISAPDDASGSDSVPPPALETQNSRRQPHRGPIFEGSRPTPPSSNWIRIVSLDRPPLRVKQTHKLFGLLQGDTARRRSLNYSSATIGDVLSLANQRKYKLDDVLASRKNPLDAKPKRDRLPGLSHLNGLFYDRLAVLVEQLLSQQRSAIARARRPAARIAAAASCELPAGQPLATGNRDPEIAFSRFGLFPTCIFTLSHAPSVPASARRNPRCCFR
jgi:hypothetical protein